MVACVGVRASGFQRQAQSFHGFDRVGNIDDN